MRSYVNNHSKLKYKDLEAEAFYSEAFIVHVLINPRTFRCA